jgi:hypothetical protein
MSFNYENIGSPICEIVDDEFHESYKKTKDVPKNKRIIVYLAEDFELSKVKNPLDRIDLEPTKVFKQISDVKKERDVGYITGRSGSGKSYYAADFIKQYIKLHPKNSVYLISSLTEDKCLDQIKAIKRVKINTPEFLAADFSSISDFKNRLFLFDDIDCMTNKKVLKKVYDIMDLILQTGRKYNVSMIHTSHSACDGAYTKLILNEAHSTTFFINGMSNVSMKYLCNSYLGLTMKQIEALKNKKTRWVTVFKTCPEVLLTQKMIVFTNDFGNDDKNDKNDDVASEPKQKPRLKSNDTFVCSCGSNVIFRNKLRHEKTPKHLKSLN